MNLTVETLTVPSVTATCIGCDRDDIPLDELTRTPAGQHVCRECHNEDVRAWLRAETSGSDSYVAGDY